MKGAKMPPRVTDVPIVKMLMEQDRELVLSRLDDIEAHAKNVLEDFRYPASHKDAARWVMDRLPALRHQLESLGLMGSHVVATMMQIYETQWRAEQEITIRAARHRSNQVAATRASVKTRRPKPAKRNTLTEDDLIRASARIDPKTGVVSDQSIEAMSQTLAVSAAEISRRAKDFGGMRSIRAKFRQRRAARPWKPAFSHKP